jgi:succinate dehydrogenase / fumarate reductase iron-sulfur subunit
MKHVHLKVRRQDAPEGLSYWEEFRVLYEPEMTVVGLLEAVRRDPITADGLPTSPVVWECSCNDGSCGACAMVINGRARLACDIPVETLNEPVVLEPMTTFPVVRDLVVDRQSMSDGLKDLDAWTELDGFRDGAIPAMTRSTRDILAGLADCVMCGACCDACPQVSERSPYAGAFYIAYAMLLNGRSTDGRARARRLDALRGPHGIVGCANVHNCDMVCPRDIPLATVNAQAQWQVMKHAVRSFFFGY